MAEYNLSYTASEIDERLGKVDSLVSSVNGVSPDESGNVTIDIGTSITVDSEFSETSTNPVQNKVVYETFYNLNDSLTTKFSSIDEEFETMQNEIDILSASGGTGSGKELLGEFTLTKDNLTSTDATGIYIISSDIKTVMSNVFSTLEDGYDVLVAELTLGDLLMVAPCKHFGGSTTLNIAQNIQVIVSTDTESGTIGQFAFTGNTIRCNTPIQTYVSYILAGNINMDVKFYKVSGGSGSGSSGEPYYKETVTIFDEDVEITDQGDGLLGANITFDMSKMPDNGTDEFEVTVDDVLYVCKIKMLMELLPYLGNERIVNALTGETGECDDTGEPFAIVINTNSSDGEAIIAMEELGTYHFKVDNVIGAKKLDSSLIDWTNGGMPSGLPEVTEEDNDKVLVVVNGKWAVDSIANGDEVAY